MAFTTDGALGTSSLPDNDVIGAEEIIAALDKLEPKLSRRILFDAHKTVMAKVVRPDLKQTLSSFSRASRTAVTIRAAKGTNAGAYIGISSKAFWLRFVNYGTKDRKTKQAKIERIKSKRYYSVGRWGRREAANRGRVQGDHRIESTLDSRVNQVLKEVQENYSDLIFEALNKEMQKVKRKFARL
jgi:hypothetical protein